MKSYKLLKEISNKILIYKNDLRTKKELENTTQVIYSQVSEEFYQLFNERLRLINYKIFFDDASFRQCATGIILNTNIINDENSVLRFECLIDHGKILLNFKHNPKSTEIRNRIEEIQNFEGLSEFSKIK